jgi:hypothetical protein
MSLWWVSVLSFIAVTTQLSLRSDGDDGDVPDKADAPVYDFGGFFELVGQARAAPAAAPQEQQLIGSGRKSAEAWPVGSWHAPLRSNETYPNKDAFPTYDTQQCTAEDMKVINYWALKQAKKKHPYQTSATGAIVPLEGFRSGDCWSRFTAEWWYPVDRWAECYQQYYPVSTPCAMCIGGVYNMAKYNMSDNCFNLCHGRPAREDGSHWCWEDCQQCMWYVGRKLSDCYGEPYDMMCRYAKELGKEGYFEKNGIDPKR